LGQNEADSKPPSPAEVARQFVDARLASRSLPDFPGKVPESLTESYAIQEIAISLWPDKVAGWKVGLIPEPLRERLAAERVSGPIFARAVWPAQSTSLSFPVFDGGFAAVEGEFVLRLGADAPASRTDWTAQDAAGLIDAAFIGVETAGSPLATINVLGSTVVAADFGNNHGLFLGPEIPGFWDRDSEDMTVETFIDGVSVGRGTAASIPGGPASALAFLLNNLASRGRPARAGDLISTGAVTGVHDIVAGQSARITFGAFGDILCHAEMARPEPV